MFWTKSCAQGVACVVLATMLASGVSIPFAQAGAGASLTVVKAVINDNSGTAVPSDFTLTVNDGSGTSTPITGNASGTTLFIAPGTYSVTEPAAAGYTTTYSADCTGSIAPGDVKTCTVTNDDVPVYVATTGTLIVVKNVINGGGGDYVPGDFTLSVGQWDVEATTTQTVTGSDSGMPVTLEAGSFYQVTEPDSAGFGVTYSADCSGTLTVGETKTCTVTNDDTPVYVATTGTLMVIKNVINDDGNDWLPGDFTMYVYYQGDGTSTQSFAGDANGTPVTLEAGSYYEVSEGENDYTASHAGDCSGKLAVGQTKTCTVTNDDRLPPGYAKVKVIKQVVNRHGGTKTAGNFTLHLEYTEPYPSEKFKMSTVSMGTTTVAFVGDENGTTKIVGTGSYRVTEDVQSDYVVGYSAGCSGTISDNQTITCTVTNYDQEPINRGGPGWSPGILESYNPFTPAPSNPGGSTTPPPSGGSANSTSGGTTATSNDSSISQFSCPITEDEARYIAVDPTGLLGLLGRQRDTALEDGFNVKLTSRVAPDTTDPLVLAAIRNYVTYGTLTTKRLGAGERAGTVASFKTAYGRLPADICDWQNVLRLANTKLPQTRVSRDLAAINTFKNVYGRNPNFGSLIDAVAQSLVGYGVRPQVRDMNAERLATSAFRKTFGKTPSTTDEWDTNRAMAYSGVTQRWLSSSLAVASSRILSIDGLGSAFALK